MAPRGRRRQEELDLSAWHTSLLSILYQNLVKGGLTSQRGEFTWLTKQDDAASCAC